MEAEDLPHPPFSEALLLHRSQTFQDSSPKGDPGVSSDSWRKQFYCSFMDLCPFTYLCQCPFQLLLLELYLIECYDNSGNLKYFVMGNVVVFLFSFRLDSIKLLFVFPSCSFTILIAFPLGFFILLPLTTSSSVKSLNFKIFQVAVSRSLLKNTNFKILLRPKVRY